MSIIKYCLICGTKFIVEPYRAQKAKYCSHSCYWKSKKGIPVFDKTGIKPWNKKQKISIICKICNQPFKVSPNRKDSAKYCSRSCAHESKRRVYGPAHPLWKRVQKSCKFCGNTMWVKLSCIDTSHFCSKRCVGSHVAFTLAHKNGPTSIEQLLMDELTHRNVKYRFQHKIAVWLIDITIPEHRIAIEADGDYWHSSEKQKVKDANKTRWLESHKWTVFRFSGSTIRLSPSQCIDKVLHYIDNSG